MIIDIEEILHVAGASLINRLTDQFNEFGLNNTFAARDSLSYKVEGNKLKIEGLLRVIILIDGRRPGRFPPVDIIEKWVNSKMGISGKEGKSVAFLIARKIAQKGTDIFIGKAKGLQVELALHEINEEIQKMISNEVSLQITKFVSNAFNAR